VTTLRTRPPSGSVPWPLILVEGGEKAGKSWMCAELSASPKVGQTYWVDLGEGTADEYGAVPGARYLIVEHDGTFGSVLGQVEAVKAEAARAAAAGEAPVVLVLDSATAEWELLKNIADAAARGRLARKGRQVAADAEPQISMDLWNDANNRHRRLMTHLMTFPGVVVVTARGKEVAALDASGRPVEGSREYKVEGQRNLAYDCSVWVRVSRERPPLIVGARSVHAGIRPGVDKPRPVPDLTLERVIFDVLRCDPRTATARDLVQPRVDPVPVPEPSAESRSSPGENTGRRLGGQRPDHTSTAVGRDQHRHMHALWRELGIDDRAQRLMVTGQIVGREVTTSVGLTSAEADMVIESLRARREAAGRVGRDPAAQPPAMTPEQRTELFGLLTDTGLATDRAKGLAAINEAIAPASVTTTKQLTEAQAAKVIITLRDLRAVPA
jgi:hypothetical protein